MQLSARRMDVVRHEVERQLRALLSERTLAFEYDYSVADPISAAADILLGGESRGSAETLAEAGPRGRAANDPVMRRVDVRVELHSAVQTEVKEQVERRKRVSLATRIWGINLVASSGVGVAGKAGWMLIELKQDNDKGEAAQYHAVYGGLQAGVSVEFNKVSFTGHTWFTTPVPMSFSDFHGASLAVTSGSVALGVGGEWSRIKFLSLVGGQPVPKPIWSLNATAGGIGGTLLSEVFATMLLAQEPKEWKEVSRIVPRKRTYRSQGQEASSHRVHFATGSSVVSADERVALGTYLARLAARFRAPVP